MYTTIRMYMYTYTQLVKLDDIVSWYLTYRMFVVFN